MIHCIYSSGRFRCGKLYVTPGVMEKIPELDFVGGLCRHLNCDWGELGYEDKRLNDASLRHGGRIFSSYKSSGGERFWIITEADRSATTILLPEEY